MLIIRTQQFLSKLTKISTYLRTTRQEEKLHHLEICLSQTERLVHLPYKLFRNSNLKYYQHRWRIIIVCLAIHHLMSKCSRQLLKVIVRTKVQANDRSRQRPQAGVRERKGSREWCRHTTFSTSYSK